MNESSDTRFVGLSLGSRWIEAVVLQTLFLFVFLLAGIANAQVKPLRSVLIIHEVGAYLPLSDYVDRGIRTSFDSSPYRIVVNREFMRAGMMFDDSGQQSRDFIVNRYRNHQPDVIIVVGQVPLQFITETHEKAFRGVPIVFCLPDRLLASLPEELHFTGVLGDIAAAKTLDAALRLSPGTKHVVVIGGVGDVDLERNAAIQNQLKSYESHLEISYFNGIPVPDLVHRLRNLPNDTIILLGNLGLDSAGNLHSTAESGAIVSGSANVPVFSLIDRSLNHGEVGGKVSDSIEQGKIAGGMALRILNGEKPQNIPIMKDVTTYMFDWRALQRWGFKESKLPPGSVVLNREPTLWERGWKYFVAGIAVILLQMISIFALFWQRARMRKVDAELAEAQHLAKLGSWRWDVATDAVTWSEELYRIAGRDPNLPAPSYQDHPQLYTAESWDRLRRAVEEALNSGVPYELDLEMVRTDGTKRWLFARGETQRDAQGRIVQLHGTVQDITERKQAEEMLSTMSRRLIEAHEEERAWIARELHDDFNQRIALMSVNLESLEGFSGSEAEAKSHIREQIRELGSDIHALSHRLHSSKLDYLGLEAACKGFCMELSARQNVEIEFHSENIPNGLSKEISLCLFRVLQEALQNAVKYSGARNFHVALQCTTGEVELSVSDSGSGFDPDEAINGQGLGLTSMKERLKLVDGKLVIKSRPGHGTTVNARVPLSPKTVAARAGS